MPSASNVIGTVLTMDTQNFVLGAQEARQLIRQLTKEFDASEAGMGRWQKSIEGLGKRMEFLEAKIKVEEALIKGYSNEIKKLSENYSQNESRIKSLEEGILNARVEINKYTKQLSDCQEELDKMWYSAEKANTPLERLNRTIREQEQELASLIVDYKNVVALTGSWSHEARDLENKIKSLNSELEENRNLLNQVNGADPLREVIAPTGAYEDDYPKGFTIGRGILSSIASDAIISGIHRLGDAFRTLISTGIEFESAFTGVKRTVEGSEEDFRILERQLLAMSSEVTASITEIADMASLAGQMGIATDQIANFTRVMIMLGDTTNISAEEAGDSLARLSNLLNLSNEDFERMGSTIVDLGNKFPTTESEIAAMASRLGGTANMLGITADEVFGIANAISTVGLEAEMGGNAISKTLREMQLAVENGTDRLSVFAEVAGLSVDEFVRLFSDEAMGGATEALRLFINGLTDSQRLGRSVTQILTELNITELRQVDTLSRLATNADVLNNSLDVAEKAWNDNIALSVEAGKRYATTESQIEFMKNSWSQTAVVIEKELNPMIRWGVNLLTDFSEMLNGNAFASENLSRDLDILVSSIQAVSDAQATLKGSIEDTNYVMYLQSLMSSSGAMGNLADTLNSVFGRGSNAFTSTFSNAEYTDPTGTIDLSAEGFFERAKQDLVATASKYGFESAEEMIDAYESGFEDLDLSDDAKRIIGNTINSFTQSTLDFQNSTKTINDNMSAMLSTASALGNLVKNGEMSMSQVLSMTANLNDDYRLAFEELVRNMSEYTNQDESWLADVMNNSNGNIDVLKSTLDQLDRFLNEEYIKLASLGSDSPLDFENGYIARLFVDRETLASYIAKQEQEIKKSTSSSTLDDYAKSVKMVADEMADFQTQLANQTIITEALGLSEDADIQARMGIYQRFINTLIGDMNDYDDILNTLTADDERYIKAEQQKAEAQALVNSIGEEYRTLFADYITEVSSFAEIQEEWESGLNQLALSEEKLGDKFDYTGEKAALADRIFRQLIAIDPSEMTPKWEEFLNMIAELTSEGTKDITDYQKAVERFDDITTLIDNIGTVFEEDTEAYSQQMSSAGSKAKSLITVLLGLDRSSLTKDEINNVESMIDELQSIVDSAGTEDAPAKSFNWWDRFLGRDNISEKQNEITDGLEAMMNDVQSVFENVGQSIFDMVDQNIQNQIDQITNEIDQLDKKLEEETDSIETKRNVQENLLRKQLESGAIDEETYYRKSAQNKYDAEAQKQKAEEETQKKKKNLMQQQDALERKQFESNKANQIAQIIIDTASAVVKTSTSLPWPWNLIPMATMAGIGAAQLAVASSQQYTPALATGGIVTAPTTALIGEAGREAVLPLESNTEWMDELAYRIGSIMTTKRLNTSIDRTLNEDGKTVENNSNVQFTQIINSPKTLSRKDIYRDTRRLVKMVDRRIGG